VVYPEAVWYTYVDRAISTRSSRSISRRPVVERLLI